MSVWLLEVLLDLLVEEVGRSPWEYFVFEREVRMEIAFSFSDFPRLCELVLGDGVGAGEFWPSPWFGMLNAKLVT